jgi:hypothetical protein
MASGTASRDSDRSRRCTCLYVTAQSGNRHRSAGTSHATGRQAAAVTGDLPQELPVAAAVVTWIQHSRM